MRAKSSSGNDFLNVSLAFRQAKIVAVSSSLVAGDAALLLESRCPSNEDTIRLFGLDVDSADEFGCDISWKASSLLTMAKSGTALELLLCLRLVTRPVGGSMWARQVESPR